MGASERKYAFSWDVIGSDIEVARPSMGSQLSMEIYRLLQFTMRDVLEQRYGTKEVDTLFFEAGVLAVKAFYERYCSGADSLGELVKTVEARFRAMRRA